MTLANVLQYLGIIGGCLAIVATGWWLDNYVLTIVFDCMAGVFIRWFVADWWGR